MVAAMVVGFYLGACVVGATILLVVACREIVGAAFDRVGAWRTKRREVAASVRARIVRGGGTWRRP